ncbi:MAG: MFS transporter [Clostridiales bacterium]|nr:MFS transporter [Clostridiales bacterium]
MKFTYKHTMYACFIGYIVQAVVNNFAPLLFLTFHSTYGIPISRITFLVTFNFGLQLVVDLLSAGFVDRIGYRTAALAAHVLSAAGLLCLAILPELLPDPFVGLLISVMVYALGGGLLEVLISPIVEACPNDNKEGAMSILHSFYCWGHVGVVLISTLFFAVFGIANWKIMAALWAVIPAVNAFLFAKVPIASLMEEGEKGLSTKELLSLKTFWLLAVLMVCAGASEQAVSQWASTFAEQSLGISKTIGDLAGPMLFAITMGTSRALYGKYSERLNLSCAILGSSLLCVASYLLISLSPWSVLGFAGCALCGFSVGILWPGTFSMAALKIHGGGTAMFAFYALAGDLGCSLGPTVVGRVSAAAGDNLKTGILTAIVFPALLVFGVLLLRKMTPERKGVQKR